VGDKNKKRKEKEESVINCSLDEKKNISCEVVKAHKFMNETFYQRDNYQRRTKYIRKTNIKK
jgi:hypothetical protein